MTGLIFEVHGTPGAQLPEHVARNIRVDDETGCWLWTASLSRDGYGWSSLKHKTYQAHRLVYTLLVGAPPEGLHLDHLCRVRHCVNPSHLEPVTPRENLVRGDTPAGWPCCQRCGSEFVVVHSQRRCPTCLAAYNESRREPKRLAERARRARLKTAS